MSFTRGKFLLRFIVLHRKIHEQNTLAILLTLNTFTIHCRCPFLVRISIRVHASQRVNRLNPLHSTRFVPSSSSFSLSRQKTRFLSVEKKDINKKQKKKKNLLLLHSCTSSQPSHPKQLKRDRNAMEHDRNVRKSLKIVEGTGDVGQKQIAVMKIERRITPNRFETNSRARKLRNSSSVKLGTFPSLFSFSFFLSFSLTLPLSIFFFYFRTLPVSRDAYTNFSSPSLLYTRLSFSLLLPFFFSYAPVSLLLLPPSTFPPIPYPLLLALRPRAPSLVDALFSSANERRESASSRICVLSLCPRSFGSIPAGNVNTLSTAAKLLLATVVSPRTVFTRRVLFVVAIFTNITLGILIEIIDIWNSLDNISY